MIWLPYRTLMCESRSQSWVQSGCDNTSRGLHKALNQAIRAVIFQVITSETSSVTAEAAGSSPVVPAISFQGVIGRDTQNANHNSTHSSLHHTQLDADSRQQRSLSLPCF